MKDNKTNLKCHKCNSPIIAYKKGEKIIYECSYCGTYPEDLSIEVLINTYNDLEDGYGKEKDM
jgi:DNA-directed RNA polymerase subunit M/transcription elongation factor TFIIS